ncbi:MAG: thiamine pyrophosphate-binding protein, partial [Bacteroidota bacterium]
MKAAQLFVKCLENEKVRFIFGLPGEENMDVLDALLDSTIEFIPTRHEQGAAFMADVQGRLTHTAGVCLSTLGPGATNLVTGVADGNLDRAPLVAVTGQAGLDRMHKESHQVIDIVELFKPITKWNTQIRKASIIPEVVRKAFKLAMTERPGATHIDFPEDEASAQVSDALEPLLVQFPVPPEPLEAQVKRASDIISGARRPVI